MNPFAMNTPQSQTRDVYRSEASKAETFSQKWNDQKASTLEEHEVPGVCRCFEDHMKYDESKVHDEKSESAQEDTKLELAKNDSIEIDGLARDQVKKIEKTVRKLLFESIHLSPEKFNELTTSVTENGELSESFGKILDKLEKVLDKLKNIAGESVQNLSEKEVALAIKVVDDLKNIISQHKVSTGGLEKALQETIDSSEVKDLISAKKTVPSVQVDQPVNLEKDQAPTTDKAAENMVSVKDEAKQSGARSVEFKESSKQVSDKSSVEKPMVDQRPTQKDTEPKEVVTKSVTHANNTTTKPASNDFKVVNNNAPQQSTVHIKEPELAKVPEDISKMVKKVTVDAKDEPLVTKDLFKKDELKNNLNKPASNQQRAAGPNSQKALNQQGQQEHSQQNTGEESAKKGLETDKKSLNFLKKLKNIVKKNDSVENPFTEQSQNKSVQKNKLNFINKMNASSLVKQIVDKIDKFIKTSQTSSATIDLQTPGLGEMKVVAEVTGAKLSLNISSLSQSIRAELIHLRSELNQDLKSLGFEDVELGFDFGEDKNSNGNSFEEEMERKRQKDPVKLPGDYLSDLAEISNWLKSFNAS